MAALPPENDTPGLRLFRRLCDQQDSAAQLIHDNCFGLVQKLVLNNVGGMADAEDVFQETLYVLLGYCGKENFRLTVPLEGLIYGIARRIWLKKLEIRGRSRITFYDIEEYVNMEEALRIHEEELQEAHRFRLLWKHLARLPEKEQAVLKAYYLEEKSHREIAEAFGFSSELSARVQKSRYLANLRELMRQDPDFE